MRLAIPIGMGEDVYKINQAYVKYVLEAGYQPVIVAPGSDLGMIVEITDGLLLPGGVDLDPIAYGENNHGSFYCDPAKDSFERDLFWEAMLASKPIFGICRGFQLIAREYLHHAGHELISKNAKTRVSDRLEFVQHIEKHSMTERFSLFRHFPHHYVEGYVAELFGDEEYVRNSFAVNSMHHQALCIDLKGGRLRNNNKVDTHFHAMAWTTRGLDDEYNGVVCEAFKIVGWSKVPLMGVQWHPEELRDYRLLHSFFGKPEVKVAAAG